jgi:PAS domain S-box-containing protein
VNAKKALRENEERLRLAVEAANLGTWDLDIVNDIATRSLRHDQIWGYDEPQEEWGLEIAMRHVVEADRQMIMEAYESGIKSGLLFHENRVVWPDGSIHWIRAYGRFYYDTEHHPVRVMGIVEDITDRKAAEEAMRENEEMFSNMVQAIPVGMALTNISDRSLYKVNPAWLSITGYSGEEEVLGKTAEQLGIIRNREAQEYYTDEFMKNGRVRNFETSIFTKTGIERTASINLDLVSISGKKYIMTSIEDITEQKTLEQQLKHKNEELTQFIYTVSHDLKSPLVTIKSFTSYLQEDIELLNKEAQSSDIAYIVNAADKMGKLLDELLELSRIGKKEAPKTEIPMKTVVQSAIDLVAGRISQRGVKVIITGPDVTLFGFQQRLMQLYQNLIDNAVKFMGDQQDPIIEIGSYTDTRKNQVVLFVRDNGSGIYPRYHSKIFGLFEKLDNKAEGSGMGLALIKRIIDVHGGDIRVDSEGQGRGTTFYFTLEKTRLG